MTCIFRAPPQIIHFTGIFPYMNGWLSNELVKWMILGTIIYKGTIIYGTSSLIHFGYPMVPSFMETPHSHGSESLRRQFPRYPDFPQFTAAAVTRPEPCTAQGTQGSGSQRLNNHENHALSDRLVYDLYIMIWYDMIWYEMILYYIIWLDMIWYDEYMSVVS